MGQYIKSVFDLPSSVMEQELTRTEITLDLTRAKLYFSYCLSQLGLKTQRRLNNFFFTLYYNIIHVKI